MILTKEYIGCCGAFCGTCKAFNDQLCKGCKLGYKEGTRDITKARCKIKACCLKNNFSSCADCEQLSSCSVINEFHHKGGYKYKKYKQAIEFIKNYGYEPFLKITESWNNQYGKY